MNMMKRGAKIMAGSVVFALMMAALAMAPGFLSDDHSTATLEAEAGR